MPLKSFLPPGRRAAPFLRPGFPSCNPSSDQAFCLQFYCLVFILIGGYMLLQLLPSSLNYLTIIPSEQVSCLPLDSNGLCTLEIR
ncbi:hypothetical protein ACP70R_004560 [Stipagrostis hirtigluma subsp. patula]